MYDGVIPDSEDERGAYIPDKSGFIVDVNALIKEYIDAMEYAKLRLGLQTVMHISARGNLYLQVCFVTSVSDGFLNFRSLGKRFEQGFAH